MIKGGSFLCADIYCQRFRPATRRPQMIGTLMSHIGIRTGSDTAGDRQMFEYALAADGPSSAVLVDHDDPDSHGQSPLRALWACSNRDATTAPRRTRGIDVTPS